MRAQIIAAASTGQLRRRMAHMRTLILDAIRVGSLQVNRLPPSRSQVASHSLRSSCH